MYRLLIILLFCSCSYIYNGHVSKKYIEPAYYSIDQRTKSHRQYAYTTTHIDANGHVHSTTHYKSVYDGTTFNEFFYNESYVFEVNGKYKDKILKETIYVNKMDYSKYNESDFIKLRVKAEHWYEFDKELFSHCKINEHVLTNSIYIDKNIDNNFWGMSSYDVEKYFNVNIYPKWVKERK